ncbi:hypothetical protein [Flavobacterium chilense]|uniref:hypothetical protein n=1 Tax=Flavobacterium chilense TaxID=946677 RepID=UPI00083A2023|nr:hypothetical protein [Flavobacterium chilense]
MTKLITQRSTQSCHFEEREILARNSIKIGDPQCGATYEDFSFLEMTKWRGIQIIKNFMLDALQCISTTNLKPKNL